MRRPLLWLLAAAAVLPAPAHAASDRIVLGAGWTIQSAAKVAEKGEAISRPGYGTEGWQKASVPNTVVGALVENGTYEDPYFGMNLRKIPGTEYPIGQRFTLLPTPDNSPFKPAWWYRKEFELPASLAGRSLFLHFNGINYRGTVWFNGSKVAGPDEIAGTFRRYEFDVTALAKPGAANTVAVEVRGPEPSDLAFMWVDWNPTPADKNMGLWDEVYLTDSGAITLRHPQVISKLDKPSFASAKLAISAEVTNATDKPVSGTVRGALEAIRFEKAVSLGPKETKTVSFTAEDTPVLKIAKPRVWWPYRMGAQELYTLALDVDVDGAASDHKDVRFGIQEMSSELTPAGHRMFKVNGKPILIRGGGWASDMMFRPASQERLETEMRYVREMGLNTIRLEGKLEQDVFYDLADRLGILVMPGWCCCDLWERWKDWDAEDYRVAPASLDSQILRLRNHPSVIAWFNGSDYAPPPDVEKSYLAVVQKRNFDKPVVSNATDAAGVEGPSGVKMRGPYDYVPPSYWLTDTKSGGAFGFATEIGPGGAVPPIESLKRFVPADKLWPINEYWTFHAGGDEFKDLKLFIGALEGRYGKATSLEDFTRKSQALTYEAQRAMFEAYARNKYTSTGVIQWMLNNAWPSMIWHLYDYYLRPGGGYFGTKKACEPLHVQYSYDDRGIVVVNDLQESFKGLKVTASLVNLDGTTKWSGSGSVDVGPDAVAKALTLPKAKDLSPTYFLRLRVDDAKGALVSENLYWLSTREDVLDWKKTQWFYTPTKVHSDLTALSTLPATTLAVTSRFDDAGAEGRALVSLENTGKAVAFQVRLKVVDAKGEEILPVYWDDNYVSVFPGEKREIKVAFPKSGSGKPAVEFEGWNVANGRSQ
jgi:exo-1,4-beta-D-glucosaminidase